MKRFGPPLGLLALALLQLPWMFCACSEGGGFAPQAGAVACDGHAHDHSHGHPHHQRPDEPSTPDHEHALTMLPVVPPAPNITLPVDSGVVLLSLVPAAAPIDTATADRGGAGVVPWDERSRITAPEAGVRLQI